MTTIVITFNIRKTCNYIIYKYTNFNLSDNIKDNTYSATKCKKIPHLEKWFLTIMNNYAIYINKKKIKLLFKKWNLIGCGGYV